MNTNNHFGLTLFSEGQPISGGGEPSGNGLQEAITPQKSQDANSQPGDEGGGIPQNPPTGEGEVKDLQDSETEKHDEQKSPVGLAEKDHLNRFLLGSIFVEGRLEKWQREAVALKEKYPDFSLEECVANPLFIKMLSLNLSPEQAYRAIYFDSVLKTELDRSSHSIISNARARYSRPSENGMANRGGVAMKSGVSFLSRGQRADIAKRALGGEKISF